MSKLLLRSTAIRTIEPSAKKAYPANRWKIVTFSDLGSVEILDSAPENSGAGHLDQTLLVLPSLMFPSAPPKTFLRSLNAAGLRVVCVRRRGFGLTSSGSRWDHETELLVRLISSLRTDKVRCLALGSAAPLALRLYELVNQVRYIDFVNIASSAVPDNAIQNQFLRKMVAQSIVGLAGAHMVVGAIKLQIRRKGPLEFAKMLYAPSTDDIEFLTENDTLMWDAVSALSGVNPKCIRDEIVAAFVKNHEPVMIEGKSGFSNFTGPDVADVFKSNALEFSNKCGSELRELSAGGVLSIYICADEYADFVSSRAL